MFTPEFKNKLVDTLESLKNEGLYKSERFIDSQQYSQVTLKDGSSVINMCANNYLGLANHPEVMKAAQEAIDRWGFGMASVRFICGTQTLHRTLEERLSAFLGTEDTILYGSCFDANGGLFESLLGEEDAIISDSLNHASIIDGVRLCKAKRYRYENNNMEDLENKLKEADANGAKIKLISTDGVFSMDGIIAQLDKIHELAKQYGALVHFDECHATGFLGKTGRGTHEHCGIFGQIDITTGTLGKALGGASGGYTSGPKEIIEILRQRSRPYLFSNSIMPAIAAATLKVLDILEGSTEYRDRVETNAQYFRKAMTEAGFTISGKDHPISPVMLGDAALSQKMSELLLKHGVYAMGFFYPVVPKGKARIRTQISACHSIEQLDKAIDAFCKAGKELGVIK
ncbi:glycine C-acetyltransferase [Akkermansia glycaniphila]|uniref:2-amino-3-ketobutyrate coenzyme A ligase n=1 Tax=Akkermansia glycaniphila TaxID=1679444 RepID=A0A1C7PDZ5_9BACT|nr:glycine C-acetyltransferase [Akkermansia glycaniphila]OCA03791.1 2-amino-3-ketobutyrate CoA ligase [Akkermansia glycaniphila]SEH82038.1 2am3keto coa: glycine c-acetyltransferase [Akkermansia glycaniphila]